MRVLFLGAPDSKLLNFFKSEGIQTYQTMERLNDSMLNQFRPELLVSHGYRHIIPENYLVRVGQKNCLNLHVSFLPWNRGADPNFWSFVDNTPKGVSIHLIDKHIDTGHIILQKEVSFTNSQETLRQTYDKLQTEIVELFTKNWEKIMFNQIEPIPQVGSGSYHQLKDKETLWATLPLGYDTPVSHLSSLGKIQR